MEFDEYIYDKIDRYLNNELAGKELEQFEVEKNANENLAKEVEIHAQMKEFLADTQENNLRRNLESLSNRFEEEKEKTPIRIIRNNPLKLFLQIAASILIAGMLWWFYSQSFNTTNDGNPIIVETPHDSPPAESQNDPLKNPMEENKETPIVNKENSQKDDDKNKESNPDSGKVKPPRKDKTKYIATDFEVIPSLDFLIGNNLRSDDIAFVIKNKIGNVSLSSLKDVVEFRFSGEIKSSENLSSNTFKVHLFSNKKSDFEDFLPINSSKLVIKKLDGNYVFYFQKNVNLQPGLYYYVVEDEKEKIHFVEKFEVNFLN